MFRRRTFFVALIPVVLLLLADPSPKLFWIGLPFVVAGEAVRIWSAGFLTKLRCLVTDGPFSLCRNPLYLGSFAIALGYFIMCGRVELMAAGVVLFWAFHGGAIIYEEKLLRELYGEEFVAYCSRTPRFLPRCCGGGSLRGFSLKQAFANDEPRTAFGTVLIVGLFGVLAYYPNYAPLRWLFR